ncbi:MAG: SLBB domain-containing protein, partial [Planctomycetia bacterium]|nr:SLBB domain-containing protein [Planctomycetia bacterium]
MSKITAAEIAGAGIVGAGGAGFPTHVKLLATPDTIVINAAECEPLLHKDKEMFLHRTSEVVDGMAVAMELTGATRTIVGIKHKYHDVIDTVRAALRTGMEVVPIPDAYPSGDEMTLVYESLGRVIPPGGLPIAVGVVVMNVETTRNLGRTAAGLGPVTEKWLTVGGAVAHPVTLRVPIGISFAECLAAAGGATIGEPYFVNGGPMMGPLVTDFEHAVVDKTTGGLLVLPQTNPV